MKHGQVNKNQIKKAFSLLEPSAQVQEDIWNKIEKQIDEPTVGQRILQEVFSKSGSIFGACSRNFRSH